jgi:very-short-patch-repair endonuclease
MSKIYQDKEWLHQNYIIEERPATEMAQMAGCHFTTIYYWLSRYEIPIRDQSVSKVVAYKNPEKRKARAKSQAELWANSEYRNHQMQVRSSSEFHTKQSETIRRVWEDPEYRQNHSNSMRALWQDPEYRRMMLPAILARWDDPEFVSAHQDRMAKLWRDSEYRRMMSEKTSSFMKALWQSPEFRNAKAEEMSKRVRELWMDPEYQEMQSLKATQQMTERWQDPEWRAKMVQVTTELWDDPEHREMMIRLMRERWQDPEWREFMSASMIEHWQEPEYRQARLDLLQNEDRRRQHGAVMRDLWEDPEFIEKIVLDRVAKIRTGYRTDIERITEAELLRLGLDYEFEYRVGRYSVDFLLPNYSVVVECDGEYWHHDKQEKDSSRDAYLVNRGFSVVHLLASEIMSDIESALRGKVLPLCTERDLV